MPLDHPGIIFKHWLAGSLLNLDEIDRRWHE